MDSGPRPSSLTGGCAAALVEQGSGIPFSRATKAKGPLIGALLLLLAGGEGFEPPLAESESAVLPLDDPPIDSVSRIVSPHERD